MRGRNVVLHQNKNLLEDTLVKVTIVGTGYVGLVSGACLADVGNDLLCLDWDLRKKAKELMAHTYSHHSCNAPA